MISSFLQEDVADDDITTAGTIAEDLDISAVVQAVEDLIFAGGPVLTTGFGQHCQVQLLVEEGELVCAGSTLAEVSGPARIILSRERVLLNLIQRMSGIASKTSEYMALVKPFGAEVIDTRKTIPGMRLFDKYAVYIGGGRNHRLDLSAAVLIKDNHVRLVDDLGQAVASFRRKYPDKMIELEVENREQLETGLACGVDTFMLDNMTPEQVAEMVPVIRTHPNGRQAYIEVSGGINSSTIVEYARAGVNGISVGALTHSVKSKDIRLETVS
ncbi:MAG: carboxylating nicotinate-nucleotide diphosphorylase [Candidatus Marinimicrobia bacterium]|nr:carboxylating nicotinate-nucleotide diphosphorylase [Candidatus Neomarinimicrobiota bacterium]